jgi:hypothetical protein
MPTDTEMLDWVLPILDSSDDGDRRVMLLAASLMRGKSGREMIADAMAADSKK